MSWKQDRTSLPSFLTKWLPCTGLAAQHSGLWEMLVEEKCLVPGQVFTDYKYLPIIILVDLKTAMRNVLWGNLGSAKWEAIGITNQKWWPGTPIFQVCSFCHAMSQATSPSHPLFPQTSHPWPVLMQERPSLKCRSFSKSITRSPIPRWKWL